MDEVRLGELRVRLEQHGWTLTRISGSHHIFQGPDRPTLSIPVHRGRVKAVYVRRVEKAIAAARRQGD